MANRIQHPQFRQELEPTKYPFGDRSSLTNGEQVLLEGTFLDARLYPIGGQVRLYLSKAVITHRDATLYVGDALDQERASVTFQLINPPDTLQLIDAYGRPAGIMLSESIRLSIFQGWGVGTFVFTVDQTEFAASVCVPTPEIGLRGIVLADGSLLTGDIWIIGDDGVVVRHEELTLPSRGCSSTPVTVPVIRVDFVGDPLFRRRLCLPGSLFATPQFVQSLSFDDGQQTIQVTPNAYGDIKITVNNDLAGDTVLRLRPTPEGIVIESVGSTTSKR